MLLVCGALLCATWRGFVAATTGFACAGFCDESRVAGAWAVLTAALVLFVFPDEAEAFAATFACGVDLP